MKSINIKGAQYKILRKKIRGLDGYCDSDKREINVCPDIKNEYFTVLLHEMIHGCFREVGIDVVNELEEVISESVSTMITQNFDISWKNKKYTKR